MTLLLSPTTGRALEPDTSHSLRDGAERWPVVDGIPYLRFGREAMVREVLACLDSGNREHALVLLLADQDDWWRGPVAEAGALRDLVREASNLTLREAMALLSWGPVADYFAHRWSDPTFLAGLGLLQAHWPAPGAAFELACGIGHYLRALTGLGVRATGVDVVFAKLWVARHWVAPGAELCCFDASWSWPVSARRFDLVACHDAFYFLEPKTEILARMRALRSPRGVLALSHVHNKDWPNLSAGNAVSASELAALFPAAAVYDDAELTTSVVERRAPRSAMPAALTGVEAFSLAEGDHLDVARPATGPLCLPAEGRVLRRNPVYDAEGRVAWPSERYAREYGPRATYPEQSNCSLTEVLCAGNAERALRRELVDLPECW